MAENKQNLKKAVESRGVEAVQEAIDNAGPEARKQAIETLGGQIEEQTQKRATGQGTQIKNKAPGYEEGSVAIPGVNVNIDDGEAKERFDKKEEITNIDSVEGANDLVTETIKEDIAQTPDKIREIESTAEQQDTEDKAFRDNQISETKEFYSDVRDLEEGYTEDLEASEDRTRELLEERKQRDRIELEKQKASELEMLERERELQSAKDKQALLDAEKQMDVSRQQAAWAYQKLGLGFSSGIINTSQQIATEGAETIAALKVQANYNQADMSYKAAQVEFEYTSEINGLIDRYTDAQLELEDSVKQRIYETQKNTLVNEEEKRTQIDALKREYVTSKREREAEIKRETERIRDKAFERTVLLQSELKAEQEFNRSELQSKIQTGQWSSLTISERTDLAKKAGLTLDEVNRMSGGTVGNTAVSYARGVLGEQFMFSPDELSKIKSDANYYTGLGYTLEEATNLATQSLVEKEYQAQLKAAAAAKAKEEAADRFVPDRNDLFQDSEGNVLYIDEDTGKVKELTKNKIITTGLKGEQYPGPLSRPMDFSDVLQANNPRIEPSNVNNIRNVSTRYNEGGESSSGFSNIPSSWLTNDN